MFAEIAAKRLARLELVKSEAEDDSFEPVDVAKHFTPNPGPQTEFWESDCTEVLYGGSAGGGKSSAITALPLKWAHLPGFQAVTLRRTFPQSRQLKAYSRELYRKAFPGLHPNKAEGYLWTFPSGAQAGYGHCQNTDDHEKYDGFEINLLCFDELTHFTKTQYDYISARVRSSNPALPTIIRATTNPGGPGHEWVFAHWGAWLDPEFEANGLEERFENERKVPPAKPGEVLWIRNVDGAEKYFREDPGFEENPAISRTFIPAKLEDNPHLAKNDPQYLAKLNKLDPVRRAQLLDGDWLVRPAAGKYFNRSWVNFVDAPPTTGVIGRIRAWDFAGTEKKDAKDNPDWTVGILLSLTATEVFIEDVVRLRGDPGTVKDTVKATAESDGKRVIVFIPQDPGQAGKDQVFNYALELRGWYLQTRTVTGDKIQRFGPFSSFSNPRQGGSKRVNLVRGLWNAPYITELEAFPEGDKDDQVDATSDAFTKLLELVAKRKRQSGGLLSVNNSER